MDSQTTPKFYLKQLLEILNQKEITILAHDNIDIDAALSGILLSRLLDFLGIKNTFKILEHVKTDETYTVLKELIKIDLKDFESISDGENESATLFLVDHYKTTHLGNVIGNIDHHPTIQHLNVSFSYTKNSSATAYLVYELMQEAKYPITKQDALMIVTAMMADTVCFKSSKALPKEIEIAKQIADSFNLDWSQIEKYALCPTSIEKMTLNEIVTNGYKEYEFSGFKVASAYVQLAKLNDTSIIEKWLQELTFNINFNTLKMYIFLVFDIENKKTYEYQITRECVKEIIHYAIISRGKDVMPRIEKMLQNKL